MGETDALKYEYLVRRAYHTVRFGVEGANADIYRALEISHYSFLEERDAQAGRVSEPGNRLPEAAIRYGCHLGIVSSFLRIAIEEAITRYPHSFSDDQKEELEDYRAELRTPTMKKVSMLVNKIEQMFGSIGLSMG
jgi:hypothetical protein